MYSHHSSDLAREIIADRLRSAEDARRARAARTARFTRIQRG
jgi:hypothetical protein